MKGDSWTDWLDGLFANAVTVVNTVQIGAGVDVLVATKSRNRVALRIFPGVSQAFYANNVAMSAINSGIHFGGSAGRGPEFDRRKDGDASTQEWHVFSAAAGAVVVVEVLAGCDCLSRY